MRFQGAEPRKVTLLPHPAALGSVLLPAPRRAAAVPLAHTLLRFATSEPEPAVLAAGRGPAGGGGGGRLRTAAEWTWRQGPDGALAAEVCPRPAPAPRPYPRPRAPPSSPASVP
jgi:hypothetical protein